MIRTGNLDLIRKKMHCIWTNNLITRFLEISYSRIPVSPLLIQKGLNKPFYKINNGDTGIRDFKKSRKPLNMMQIQYKSSYLNVIHLIYDDGHMACVINKVTPPIFSKTFIWCYTYDVFWGYSWLMLKCLYSSSRASKSIYVGATTQQSHIIWSGATI
jgi:hypothetical protein